MRSPVNDQALMEIVSREAEGIYSDPLFVAAERDWSDCMVAKGFDYPTPRQAKLSVVYMQEDGQTDPLQLQSLELALAVADMECALDTVVPQQIELELQIVQRLAEAFPDYAPDSAGSADG